MSSSSSSKDEETPSFMSVLGAIGGIVAAGAVAAMVVGASGGGSEDGKEYITISSDDDSSDEDAFIPIANTIKSAWAALTGDESSSSSSSSSSIPAPTPILVPDPVVEPVKPVLIGVANREQVLDENTQLFWRNLTVSQLVVTGPHRVTMVGGLLTVPRVHLDRAVYDHSEAGGTLRIEFLPAVWPPRHIPKFQHDHQNNFQFQLVGFVNVVSLSNGGVAVFDAPLQTLVPKDVGGQELDKQLAMRNGCFWRTKFLLENDAQCRMYGGNMLSANKFLISCSNRSNFWLLDCPNCLNLQLIILDAQMASTVYIELDNIQDDYPRLMGNCKNNGRLQLMMKDMTRNEVQKKLTAGLLADVSACPNSSIEYTANDISGPSRMFSLSGREITVPARHLDFTQSYNNVLEMQRKRQEINNAAALAARHEVMDQAIASLITPSTRKKVRTEGVRRQRTARRKKSPTNPVPEAVSRGSAPAPFALVSTESEKAAAPFVPLLDNPDQPYRKGKNIECVICNENRALMAPDPCGHLKYCYNCTLRTKKKWDEDRISGMSEDLCSPKCCICRMPISKFITMYYDDFDAGSDDCEDNV